MKSENKAKTFEQVKIWKLIVAYLKQKLASLPEALEECQ
jgi:hypothetical protein